VSLDISNILNSWPYRAGEVNVRRIKGEDGKERIQLRLDLGLLQMETTGRPDGQRPHGCESLLEYYEQKLHEHQKEHGNQLGFEIDEDACEELRGEGVMYYHRYLSMFVLGDYQAVVRDTQRNLHMFDFCNQFAAEEADQHILEQYRPYVQMMYSRAAARLALRRNKPIEALEIVQNGIQTIRTVFETFEIEEDETSGELSVLRALEREIQQLIPLDPAARLERELRNAISEERYEDAAILRDQLSRVEDVRQESNSHFED
jgi:hypothetical protein